MILTKWMHLSATQKWESSDWWSLVMYWKTTEHGDRGRERENEKVSGSVYRLWSLGLVSLQPLHCRSHLTLISAALLLQHLLSTVQLLISHRSLSSAASARRPAPASPCLTAGVSQLHFSARSRKGEQAPPMGPESQPHPDKQMGFKGARLFVRTQSLLDKEKTSWQSHLDDVDRWHPIVVVVLGELWEERERWQVWGDWGNQTNVHEDASVIWCFVDARE